MRNYTLFNIILARLTAGNLKKKENTLGKNNKFREILLKAFDNIDSLNKFSRKEQKNLKVFSEVFKGSIDNLKQKKISLAKEVNFKRLRISKKLQRENMNTLNYPPVFLQFQKITETVGKNKTQQLFLEERQKLLKNYKKYHSNGLLNKLVNKTETSKGYKREIINFADVKGITLSNKKEIKKSFALKGVKKVDYQSPIKSFQIKIPLEENLVIKIKTVRNNFYAKINTEGQTANLLVQNLQMVAQQIANLGFSKAVIGLYTSGGAGKGFSGQRGSEDGNNKHKNAEKISKPSDKSFNRVNNFRYLL